MPEVLTSLPEALHLCARESLEEMFFMVVFGISEDDAVDVDAVCARVEFTGDARGALSIAVSRKAAVEAASNFLGEDAPGIAEEQVNSVITEMANILCGSALSRWRYEGQFVLASPVITPYVTAAGAFAQCALQLEEGSIWLSLVLDEPSSAE